jgi:hypothetical protein
MAFRSDDQDYRWPRPGAGRTARPDHSRSDSSNSLSLQDTLRELAITIIGFVGVILLITAVVSALG